MLDIKFIRENKDLIEEAVRKKHLSLDVGDLLKADDARLKKLQEVDDMRAKQNTVSTEISQIKDSDKRSILVTQMKALKDDLQKKEEELKKIMKKWQTLMLAVPNIPDVSVPEGESDADNKEVRSWGEIVKPKFTPKTHYDLMQERDLLDLERGVKISGFRGYVLKNDAVLLYNALIQFVTYHLTKKDFTPMMFPSLINKEGLMGTGYLPGGEDDLYVTQDRQYLSGTSEVPAMTYHMNEVLDAKDLPKKMLAYSPCFRREAGSHGRDTKGLIRVHEFYKIEQLILCEASHEESVKLHEEVTKNAEELMQMLELPYRVVVNCGGDLGLGQVKKYDIEVWMPAEGKYRETHSASYFHDFQSRRLNIKYKDSNGKKKFVHSLNNTAFALPRIIAALIENNQNEDGSISIPKALTLYMGKEVI